MFRGPFGAVIVLIPASLLTRNTDCNALSSDLGSGGQYPSWNPDVKK